MPLREPHQRSRPFATPTSPRGVRKIHRPKPHQEPLAAPRRRSQPSATAQDAHPRILPCRACRHHHGSSAALYMLPETSICLLCYPRKLCRAHVEHARPNLPTFPSQDAQRYFAKAFGRLARGSQGPRISIHLLFCPSEPYFVPP